MDYKIKNPKEMLLELREEIEEKKITQIKLANKLKKKQAYVSRVLNGKDCMLSTYTKFYNAIKEL